MTDNIDFGMEEFAKMSVTIWDAQLAVMQKINYVQKRTGKLPYAVTAEADVLNLCREPMLEEGIVMIPETIVWMKDKEGGSDNGIVAVFQWKFLHVPSRTFQHVQVFGRGLDKQDKDVGKAMTYAKKYALMQFFMLITGEDPDLTPPPAPKPAKAKVPARPWTPVQLKAMLQMQLANIKPLKGKALDSAKAVVETELGEDFVTYMFDAKKPTTKMVSVLDAWLTGTPEMVSQELTAFQSLNQ